MINYFKELLLTLKSINKNLELLSKCVRTSDRHYGDRHSISTKHWND